MRTYTIEKTVYSFGELSEQAKNKARDWYREGNDFEFHAECVMEDAKTIGKLLGIDIEKIYYSGFCSQGDGACFVGSFQVNPDAVKQVKEYAPLDTRLHDIALLLSLTSPVTATIEHRGRYYHSGSMRITCESEDNNTTSEHEILEDALRSFADWIYRGLNREYEYQNSDEQVDDGLLTGEYEFDENGRIA